MTNINLISRSYMKNFFNILESENGSPLFYLFYKENYGYIFCFDNKFLNKNNLFEKELSDSTLSFIDFDEASLFLLQNLKLLLKKINYDKTQFNVKQINYLKIRSSFLKNYNEANQKLKEYFQNKGLKSFVSYRNKTTPYVCIQLPFFDYDNIRGTNFFDREEYSLSISTGSNGNKQQVIYISIYPINEFKEIITPENLFIEIYEKIIYLEYNCTKIFLKEKMKGGNYPSFLLGS